MNLTFNKASKDPLVVKHQALSLKLGRRSVLSSLTQEYPLLLKPFSHIVLLQDFDVSPRLLEYKSLVGDPHPDDTWAVQNVHAQAKGDSTLNLSLQFQPGAFTKDAQYIVSIEIHPKATPVDIPSWFDEQNLDDSEVYNFEMQPQSFDGSKTYNLSLLAQSLSQLYNAPLGSVNFSLER